MTDVTAEAAPARTLDLQWIEFRGKGSEYFRIWIVNLVLTILTLGIYGAWAKVRTWRYFYANTYIGGHSFDYHASPLRILVGRIIALVLLVAYSLSVTISPALVAAWFIIFIFALPWLAVTSIRFNARNTSYRNIRFNFDGTYGQAFVAYILWMIAGGLTLGLLVPRARKAMDYFYVDHHTYGGRHFKTEFSTWSIYGIYLIVLVGLIVLFGAISVVAVDVAKMMPAVQHGGVPQPAQLPQLPSAGVIALMYGAFAIFLCLSVIVQTMIYNLVIGHTMLDGRHELRAKLSPLRMVWIVLSNAVLTLVTLGFFYPWALVRIARYRRSRTGIVIAGDLDGFTADVAASQSAVGEEIASFFDFDFGL